MDRIRVLILVLLPFVASQDRNWPLPPTPANVEVHLVLPRPNQTYRPVWPFPIVFGIRNASSVWYNEKESADLVFKWKLIGFNDTAARDSSARDIDGTFFGSELWQPSMEKHHEEPPADDLLLKVWAASRDLIDTPEKHFRLLYQLVLRSMCLRTNATQPLEPGFIDFSTDNTVPELPNILHDDSCASHIASVAIADMRRTSETGAVCVIPGMTTVPPERCGLKVDKSMADQIETEVLNLADCPKGTWPDAELTRTSCNAKNLATHSTGVPSAIAAFFPALVATWGFA